MGVAARLDGVRPRRCVLVFGRGLVRGRARPARRTARRPGRDAGRRPRRAASTASSRAAATDGLASAAAGYRLAVADPTFVAGRPRRAAVHRDRPGRPARHRVRRHPARPAPAARRRRAPRRRGLPAPRPDHGPATAPGAPRCGCPRPGVWRAFVDTTPTAGPATRARRRPVRRGPVRARSPSRPRAPPRSATSSSGSTATWCPAPRRRSSPPSAATAWASPTCSPTSARSASSSRSARATSPTPPPTAAPAVGDRAGPAVAFTASVPSAGTYRLFLQFRVADVMHTAEFTVPTRNP